MGMSGGLDLIASHMALLEIMREGSRLVGDRISARGRWSTLVFAKNHAWD